VAKSTKKIKNKMDRSPSIKTCQKHMGDISSMKRKVQKKEIQDDSLIQSKWKMNYKKLKIGAPT
jgi:hypothetical protein